MPSLEFFLLSQSISVDQRSNRLSIFEIVDDLEPVNFPAWMPRLMAISVWLCEQGDQGQDFQATLQVTGANIPMASFPQNFTAEGVTQRILHHLVNVPILSSGEILFEILLNGERKASHRVRVAAANGDVEADGFLIYRPAQAIDNVSEAPQTSSSGATSEAQ